MGLVQNVNSENINTKMSKYLCQCESKLESIFLLRPNNFMTVDYVTTVSRIQPRQALVFLDVNAVFIVSWLRKQVLQAKTAIYLSSQTNKHLLC